ncbi:metallo-beta-lactamase family protein [Stylonychia lemnae]|uniref:Metallo-beta-lactamase family protein n=1 Tax=Stylonychia lemnae TaxID=5949 RepID=A0A078B4J0_STYLE|nr:metallo-beta-lactamase family protein [Stylonychia lemnae]|eukprot:CDW88408.1 metallo-beta-lactamase family protein [Stylonychia lemnae]
MAELRWLGHAGFRLAFPDPKDASVTRVIYFDPWMQNPKLPEDLQGTIPTDADLVLVSHGHFDHAGSAPDLIKASQKEGVKVVANYEIFNFYKKFHNLTDDQAAGMNKGGQLDFGFCTVQMVSADHSSGCMAPDQNMHVGGEPAGFVVSSHDFAIYHAGDTNVFTDMDIINYLYRPTHLLLPIGGHFTMGPREAAYAVCKFLVHAKVVVPMHFQTFPLLKGTVEDFLKEAEKFAHEFSRAPFKTVDPHSLLQAGQALP